MSTRAEAGEAPLLLLVNPTAGGGRGLRVAERARRWLADHGVATDLVLTKSPLEVLERARQAAVAGAARIAVAGGDGTVQQAARGLAGTRTALALLPCGRGNDLARALGVPLDPEGAARTIAEGRPRPVDLGRAGGALFVTVSTFGFDAEVSAIVQHHAVPGRGALAYVLAALKALRSYRPAEATIAGDFGRIDGPFLLVATANTRSYGGGMRIAPDALPDDGLLDVCAVRAIGRLRVLRVMPEVFRGRHVRRPEVVVARTRSLRIECARPMALYADGEPLCLAPATIEVVPAALHVIAPVR